MSKTTSTLPENVVPITLYNSHRFTNVYYGDDNFYVLQPDGNYKVYTWWYNSYSKSHNIFMRDDNGVRCLIKKDVFYKIYWFG